MFKFGSILPKLNIVAFHSLPTRKKMLFDVLECFGKERPYIPCFNGHGISFIHAIDGVGFHGVECLDRDQMPAPSVKNLCDVESVIFGALIQFPVYCGSRPGKKIAFQKISVLAAKESPQLDFDALFGLILVFPAQK